MKKEDEILINKILVVTELWWWIRSLREEL